MNTLTKYAEYTFESEYDAIDFAEECGKYFVRYTGSSWATCDDGDYGVLVEDNAITKAL